MHQFWRRGLAVSVLAAALPLAACDDDIAGSQDGEGRVSVLLTDAAGDIKTAIVTVNSVYLHSSGSGDQEAGRVYLLGSADASAELETNVTDLSNSIQEIVDSEPVPAGTYGQLRIVIDDACIVVEGEDGEDEVHASSGFEACGAADGNLQTTSTTQNGIKINFAGGLVIEEGEEEEFLLDFDVSQSFKPAGNSGQWVMTPVIKGATFTQAAQVVVNVNLGSEVTLPTGVVLTGFSARLTNAEGSSEEIALSSDGRATFRYLIPGTYSLSLVAPGGFVIETDPASPTVTVPASGSVTSNLTITSITTAGT